jgi:hypothetical protein
MVAPKWFIIGRNEYRIRTSVIRKIRPYFLYLALGILIGYVVFIAPALVRQLISDFYAFIISQAALAMVEIVLFFIFIYFVIAPITSALREEQIEHLHIFLSAPVSPSDVLLGQFLGSVPLYAILITLITGFFAALLTPLGLSMAQLVVIIVIFVLIFLSAFWIGTVAAALLKTKFGKTARGKDIGRALAMLLVLPLVAFYYVMAYGGLFHALFDPGASGLVKTVLGWLPSSWGAEIIVTFASNTNAALSVGIVARFCGLLIFFAASLWVGTKIAHRAYSLEPTSFISSRANPDGIFYKTIRYVGGSKSFGTVVVSLFKDYSRRLENLSLIFYMMGVLFLMVVFIAPQSTGPDDPPVAILLTLFIFPIIVVMVTGEVTVRGKESLFIFRKAPSGEERFAKAMIFKSWLMAVPIAGVATVSVTFFTAESTLIFLSVLTGLMMLFVAGYVVFVLGLFLLNPAFSEKSVKLWINIIISVAVSIGLFLFSLLISTGMGQLSEPIGGLVGVLIIQAILSWAIGAVFLPAGKKRLSKIE